MKQHWTEDFIDRIERIEAENEALKARVREFDKSIDAEMRDPNGTIWEYANELQAKITGYEECLRAIAHDDKCANLHDAMAREALK